MSGAPSISRQTSVLCQGLSFDAAPVRGLVNGYWAGRPDRTRELDNVLWQVQSWDDDWTRLAVAFLAAPETPAPSAHMLVSRVAKIDPARAAELLAAKVGATFEMIQANPPDLPEPPPNAPKEEQAVARWRREDAAQKPYRKLLTEEDWHPVPDAAKRAPRPFLDQLWPILIKVVDTLARPYKVGGYRRVGKAPLCLPKRDRP